MAKAIRTSALMLALFGSVANRGAEAVRVSEESQGGAVAPGAEGAVEQAEGEDMENDELVGQIQECVDSVRKGEVVMAFESTEGPLQLSDALSHAAAGCFFHLAREAYMSARDADDDASDMIEVQVNLAAGSNDWSRVSKETLDRMLAFGAGKLEKAKFDVAKIEFSKIERPVQSDLVAARALQEDAEFIQEVAESQKLFSLATASHYVDFPQLYQLCTAKIATMIWGKTKQEIEEVLSKQG